MIRDTLLIIDDSELDRTILNGIFKNLFHVECVANAAQGRPAVSSGNTRNRCAQCCWISAWNGGAPALMCCTPSRHHPGSSNLPVVLITADAHEKDVRSGVKRGAVDFLAKPVDPHTVQKRVCQMVRATWPPMTTILDQMDKSKRQEPPAPCRHPRPLRSTPGKKLWEGVGAQAGGLLPVQLQAGLHRQRPACSWALSLGSLHGAMYSSIPNWD